MAHPKLTRSFTILALICFSPQTFPPGSYTFLGKAEGFRAHAVKRLSLRRVVNFEKVAYSKYDVLNDSTRAGR